MKLNVICAISCSELADPGLNSSELTEPGMDSSELTELWENNSELTEPGVNSSELTIAGMDCSETGLTAKSKTTSFKLDLEIDKCLSIEPEEQRKELNLLDRAIEESREEFEVNDKKMDDSLKDGNNLLRMKRELTYIHMMYVRAPIWV